MDRMVEIHSTAEFCTLATATQEKWMSLHDAHHEIPRNRPGAIVAATRLTSEASRCLNGRLGTLLESQPVAAPNGKPARWAVQFPGGERRSYSKKRT